MDNVIKLNLLGLGSIGRIVLELVAHHPKVYGVEAFYDDAQSKLGESYRGIKVKSSIKNFVSTANSSDIFFNCLGNINAYQARINYSKTLRKLGVRTLTLSHHSASVSPSVEMGSGCLICPMVVLHTNVKIGEENIIFSNTVIEHDSTIGDYCYLSPSVTLCGKVILNDGVYLGPNAVLAAGITIGKNAIVGAGSIVLDDIPDNSVYVGNPAKFLKMNELWRTE